MNFAASVRRSPFGVWTQCGLDLAARSGPVAFYSPHSVCALVLYTHNADLRRRPPSCKHAAKYKTSALSGEPLSVWFTSRFDGTLCERKPLGSNSVKNL